MNTTAVRGAGEQDASGVVDFEAFYEAHAERLRRVVTRRVRDAHLAEDIVQETFLRAHRFIDRLDQERSPWPWLRTIAMRLAFNATRNQRFDKEDLVAEPVELPDVDGAAVQGERRLLQARLVRVLASLPQRQQRLLVLHDMFGIGCDELALTEGATASALRKATSRARRALRDDAHAARLGVLAPVAACLRALHRAQARVYGRWLRHVGQRRGGMALTGGEALAPIVVMACALVPSMMLAPAHADAGSPHRAAADGVQIASTGSQALPILPTDDADLLALARPVATPANEGGLVVEDDEASRGAVVGPAELGAEAPMAAELEAGERMADGEAGTEQDAPNASTPPTTAPAAPPSHTFTGPINDDAGSGVVGGGDPGSVGDGPGPADGLKTPTDAPEIVNPTYGGMVERAALHPEPGDTFPGVRL